MIRRIAITLAAAGAAAAIVPATGQAATYGFSEQQASMFDNPLYQNLDKARIARYVAPYDVMTDPVALPRLEAWMDGAKRDNVKVLISFYHDREKPMTLPSVKKYTTAIKRFKTRYGSQVESVSPWNEANRDDSKNRRFRGPSARQAAAYYDAGRKVFKGKKIVGLDILDQQNIKPALAYIKSFKRYAKVQPKIWGLHNYSDTNRGSSTRTRAVLKAVKGDVWLTETGGIVKLGTSFPEDQQRAARSLEFMFKLAKSNARLKRLYIYQFSGATELETFDAGLINPDGSPRPGYGVVAKRLG